MPAGHRTNDAVPPADPVTHSGTGPSGPRPDGPVEPGDGTAAAGRWPAARPVRGARTADWVAVAVLVAVPTLMFGLPALAGHPLMPGDDMDQNYPLRVLVGRDLRAGQWPVLNPYIWGGTPLLGGWNAGAAYPFTWLFAVLPPLVAWVANEVLTYATAGLGLYAFCRHQRLRPVAALLAAASFTFGGAYALQLVHLGLVAGASWIPLVLLALARLSTPDSCRGRACWVAVLGLAGGLCVLAGEPRAIDTAAVVAGGYALWRLARTGVSRWGFVGSTLAGGTLAVLLGAVQWAPGLAAVATSQRAAADYALFAGGSLHASWLSLLAVPTVLGGSGSLGLPGFFATYNLPEVASYVGLLPLVAAAALLGRLPLRGWWRRRRGDATEPVGWPEWFVWHVLALVGVVLALGANTPLGPALHSVPLFGDQRLQSRNIMITDLALAVLLGYWADGWLARGRARVPRPERVLAWVPVVAVVGLSVAGIARGPALARSLGVDAANAGHAGALWPAFTGSLLLALAVAAYLRLGPRLRTGVRAGVLVAVVAVDLAGFVVVAAAPSPVPPSTATVTAQPVPPPPFDGIGRDARFAVYGPSGVGTLRLGGVGVTDLNVLSRRYSMQGYTAIVDGRYATATGTHLPSGGGHDTLSTDALAAGRLDQLATGYLLTPPRYLVSGPLRDALAGRGWTFAGTLDGYAVFTNPHATPPLSLRALPGRPLAGATVDRTAGDPLAPTSAAVSSPAGVLVVRAVAAIPGWTATWRPADGAAARTLPVTGHDLVQAVAVPPGDGVLSWRYRAPGLALGVVLGLVGLVATAGLLAGVSVAAVRGRRARPGAR